MTKNTNSFLNEVDIQLILDFKNSFGKYHSVFPKNSLKGFLGRTVHISIYLIK